ncbi:hypothetical protein PsYK624_011040 [Phanerochaete sordida]|uniref:Uncharacterized protein n=1 Tax=Phanerochaete sordida TaxID=48140 RepID=A0A9P3FXL4_9APHY|nr:hypothetical protein PsYK624_011040 [Phanerochaete sordida]
MHTAHKELEACETGVDCLWSKHRCTVDDNDFFSLPAALEEKCPALHAVRERYWKPPRISAPPTTSTASAEPPSSRHGLTTIGETTGLPGPEPAVHSQGHPSPEETRAPQEANVTWWRQVIALPSVVVVGTHVVQRWTSLAERVAAGVGGSQPLVLEDISMEDMEAAGGDGTVDSGSEAEHVQGGEGSERLVEVSASAMVVYGDPNVV